MSSAVYHRARFANTISHLIKKKKVEGSEMNFSGKEKGMDIKFEVRKSKNSRIHKFSNNKNHKRIIYPPIQSCKCG